MSLYLWSYGSDFVIVNDVNIYNNILSLIQEAVSNGYDISADNLYYCEDIIESFIMYVNGDFDNTLDFSPPNDFDFSDRIELYKSDDCYHTQNPYVVSNGAYLNSVVYFKDRLFYDNSYLQNQNNITEYQILSNNYFYLVPSVAWQEKFLDCDNEIDLDDISEQYFNSNVVIKSWDKSNFDFFGWLLHAQFPDLEYNDNHIDYVKRSIVDVSKNENFIKYLDEEYSKLDKVCLLSFTLTDAYSGITTGKNFDGTKIVNTGRYYSFENKDSGLGSSISSTIKELNTDLLLKDGFSYGKNNTDHFPYVITMSRNGSKYAQIYLKEKANVSTDYYSNNCIRYNINLLHMVGYLYLCEENVYKDFNLLTATDGEYWGGTVMDNDLMKKVATFLASFGESASAYIFGIDISTFSTDYSVSWWTNYSGTKDNYQGWYVTFNWDLSTGNFNKNNSDDIYDYTQDYIKDEVSTDNNGHISGGGDEGASLVPTSSVNGVSSEFEFTVDELTSASSQFAYFLRSVFSILPAWVWGCVLIGLTIIVICRLLGR